VDGRQVISTAAPWSVVGQFEVGSSSDFGEVMRACCIC
jgi:hypothetical protein